MRITTQLKSIFTAGFAVFVLSGCSSGSTAIGLGIGIGGTWFGELLINNNVIATFSMSLSQAIANNDGNTGDTSGGFEPSALTGTFNSSDRCIGGGTVTGLLTANTLTLDIATANGTLSMSGEAQNSKMGGSWVNAGSITDGEGEGARVTTCNKGGLWTARR